MQLWQSTSSMQGSRDDALPPDKALHSDALALRARVPSFASLTRRR